MLYSHSIQNSIICSDRQIIVTTLYPLCPTGDNNNNRHRRKFSSAFSNSGAVLSEMDPPADLDRGSISDKTGHYIHL